MHATEERERNREVERGEIPNGLLLLPEGEKSVVVDYIGIHKAGYLHINCICRIAGKTREVRWTKVGKCRGLAKNNKHGGYIS